MYIFPLTVFAATPTLVHLPTALMFTSLFSLFIRLKNSSNSLPVYSGRRQNQSGQFFQHFHVGTSSRFVVFFIICRVPFHFEAGPLLALFYPTTVAFVNCQLHQTFSPAFVVFSRTNLRKDPLPCPGQKPENISGVYTILPRFGAKLKVMGTAGCRS